MNLTRIIIAVLCLALCSLSLVQAQEMDKELSDMATRLATLTKENAKKKVTVLDFTDLQGGSSELGKYVAEQLTVNLVMVKKDFSVLDRANLKKILAEHKLTATGLIDPENAKKLGQFAGVDALILGTIVSKGQKVSVTAKIITTDTAEIVDAAKAEFNSDEIVKGLLSKPADSSGSGVADTKEQTKVSKVLGDLRVDVKSLTTPKRGGNLYHLSMDLVNINPKKSIWVAVNTDVGTNVRGGLTDPDGSSFITDWGGISGIKVTAQQHGGFFHATEISPTNSISVTMEFISRRDVLPTPGICNLQMEFLLGYNFDGDFGPAKVQNFSAKVKAD